jgi:hypothetical protein
LVLCDFAREFGRRPLEVHYPLFYEIVGALVAVFVVIVAVAVRATRRRSRAAKIPRQK